MRHETILYISDQETSNSALAALKATGYEVVSTDSSTEAIALLFILHSVGAVVLHHQARERNLFEVARSLRAFCQDVPIVLLCHDQIECLPSCVDAYLSTGEALEKLTSAVRGLLTANRFRVHSGQC